MCENNNVIVFDQHEYIIFEGEVSIQGRVVHSQNRDPLTGLYPLTLTTDIRPEIIKREHVLFTDVNELRNVCHMFRVWAEKTNKNKKNNFTDEEQQVDSIDKENNTLISNLARIYIKEGMSDMEMHSKLGHVGTKIIKHCNIQNLKIHIGIDHSLIKLIKEQKNFISKFELSEKF